MDFFEMMLFFIVCMVGTVLGLAFYNMQKTPITPDPETIKMCKWYAEQGHYNEVEFSTSKERAEWLGRDFIDKYDWYDSCINHFKYPVAKGTR